MGDVDSHRKEPVRKVSHPPIFGLNGWRSALIECAVLWHRATSGARPCAPFVGVGTMADAPNPSSTLEFDFPGSDPIYALMREVDWSATALGPSTSWPASLRTALDAALSLPQPAL